MQKIKILFLSLITLIFCTGTVYAEKGGLAIIMEGCKKDLQSFCKDVTPGEGRIAACLYAYSDKLSSQCVQTLYENPDALEEASQAVNNLLKECGEDITQFCGDVPTGKGLILPCLKKNNKKISRRCRAAMKAARVD